jgi:hypothetical protein
MVAHHLSQDDLCRIRPAHAHCFSLKTSSSFHERGISNSPSPVCHCHAYPSKLINTMWRRLRRGPGNAFEKEVCMPRVSLVPSMFFFLEEPRRRRRGPANKIQAPLCFLLSQQQGEATHRRSPVVPASLFFSINSFKPLS